MKKLLIAILCTPLFSLPVCAETSLWMVKTEKTTTYLGGTFHLLRPADYPLPPQYDAAYAGAQTVVFEADPGRLASPEVLQMLAHGARYPEGKTLERELTPETYALLRQHCERAGIPLAALNQFKPAMVALTLLSVEMARLGVSQQGVDYHFYERAIADRKGIGELESAEAQVDYILSLGEGDADRFIRLSLRDLERSGEMLGRLITAWRAGDMATLDKELVVATRTDFPELYRTLFLKRNADWLPQVEAFIRSPETELILVGVAHLAGADGLVETLRRRGFEVVQVK